MRKGPIRFAAAVLAALLFFSCAVLAEAQLPYRIATGEEGASLLLGNRAYCEGFSQRDLDYRVQKKGATIEDWRAFAAEQTLDFTDAERAALGDGMAAIEGVLNGNGYSLPEMGEIVFVKTTQREECGSAAYTLGNQIYLGEDVLDWLRSSEEDWRRYGRALLCHEIFHCLTRSNPQFRRDMYAILHFEVGEEEFELSPELKAIYYSNPDVGRHDASAAFVIGGRETECYVVTVVEEPFEAPGDDPFERIAVALVPVENPDIHFAPEDAANFWDVFGRNTSYVLDPEECLADNFGYALIYGDEDENGAPVPNPEILDGIRAQLRK